MTECVIEKTDWHRVVACILLASAMLILSAYCIGWDRGWDASEALHECMTQRLEDSGISPPLFEDFRKAMQSPETTGSVFDRWMNIVPDGDLIEFYVSLDDLNRLESLPTIEIKLDTSNH